MERLYLLLSAADGDLNRMIGFDMQLVQQVIINMVALAALGIILYRLMYGPIRKILHDRTERIRNQLADAKEGRAAAGELRAKYDRHLKDIDLERTAILEEARRLAAEQRDHILNTAKDEAKDLKDRAGMEIEAERDRVRDELHAAVIDISSDMAEKLLAAAIDKDAHARLFAEGLAELDRVLYLPAEA